MKIPARVLSGTQPHIAIIGGGPGGLFTAWQLQQTAKFPYTLTIIESSSRLGGKIRTESFTGAVVMYEAGAAELYDYSHLGPDPLHELIVSMGLLTQPMAGRAVVRDGMVFPGSPSFAAAHGETTRRALDAFDKRARAWMSPQEYYESDWAEDGEEDPMLNRTFAEELDRVNDEPARQYIETLVHSDLATEPHLTSAAYGLQNYLMNEPEYMSLYTIEGGIERLPEALAQRLTAQVLVNTRVEQVGRNAEGKLRIAARTKDRKFEQDFDYVVAALPSTHLQLVGWHGGDLPAAMRRHHRQFDFPAHYLRVSVLFREVFWKEHFQDSYLMLDSFGGCCLYDESSRNDCAPYGTLGWLLAGEAAMMLANLTDAEIVDRVLSTLPDFLQRGAALFVEARVHRWIGEVNGLPGGRSPVSVEMRHIPDPHTPNLLVVGDYLFDSTLNGVLDSATFVAEHLCEVLEPEAAVSAVHSV